MKRLIEIPDNVLLVLNKEAKTEKRSLKAHLEYILIKHSKGLKK